ncbi:MAG: HAD family hydrolase [Ilumatobacteraceae bacterium]
MPIVVAGSTSFDVAAIAFDKDGTLIDLQATWGPIARAWIDGVGSTDERDDDANGVRQTLARRLGYDLAEGTLVADGVLAAGTLAQIRATTVESLHDQGLDAARLHAALERGLAAVAEVGPTDPVPLADLAALFGSLCAADVRCAIVTSDARSSAVGFVDRFRLGPLVATIVGGDDTIRPKPAPDPLLAVAERLGIDVARILMVGDSTTDQGTARAAGCPFVAVGRGTAVAADCDALIDSVGEITVGPLTATVQP